MAHLKGCVTKETCGRFRECCQECIRMRNGMHRTLERHLPECDRRWPEHPKEQGSGFRKALSSIALVFRPGILSLRPCNA